MGKRNHERQRWTFLVTQKARYSTLDAKSKWLHPGLPAAVQSLMNQAASPSSPALLVRMSTTLIRLWWSNILLGEARQVEIWGRHTSRKGKSPDRTTFYMIPWEIVSDLKIVVMWIEKMKKYSTLKDRVRTHDEVLGWSYVGLDFQYGQFLPWMCLGPRLVLIISELALLGTCISLNQKSR